MPLLIKDDDLFNVIVHYIEKERDLFFFEEDESKPNDVKTETFKFKYPNWTEQQTIMAGALTIDSNGMPFADPYRYMDSKIKTLLRGWTIKYEDGSDVPVTIENIEKMNSSLVNYLNKQVDEILGSPSSLPSRDQINNQHDGQKRTDGRQNDHEQVE